jgi:hypothetical protein
LIEARCQYRGEGGKRASVRYLSSPRGQGTSFSLYRSRGGGLQLCCTVLTTCGGMVYNATEWMAILANLAPVGRRGESCSRPRAASRVAVWELPVRSPPYAGSRVQPTKGHGMHSSGRGDVLSSRIPTAPGRVLQRSGWWHSGGDGCTGPTVTEETRCRCFRPATYHGEYPR